jgi:MFS family permease
MIMALRRKSVWVVSFVLALGFVVNYVDRGNVSVAAPVIQREFHLNPTQLGLLFSAFFLSYAVMQVPAGFLVERFNLKWLYAAAFLWWSLANAGVALAVGFTSLLILRMLLSVGEAISLPASSKLLASTFPEYERGIANGILDSGYKFGPALGVMVGGLFLANHGWRLLFIVTGLGGLFWLIPWFWIADSLDTRRPTEHESQPLLSTSHARLSVGQILRSPRAWGTFVGNFCGGYVWYLMLSWVPTFLVSERHMNLSSMGVFGSLLFVFTGIVSISSGLITDRMLRRGASPSKVRLGFMVAGLSLSMFLVPAGFASNTTTAFLYLSIACASYGMYSCNIWAVTQSIAGPPNIGRWSGIQNLVGNLGGVASPVLTGWIVTKTSSFRWAFVVAAGVMFFGILIYLLVVRTLDPIESVSGKETISTAFASNPHSRPIS